jgi:hypothetical protein
MACSAIVSGCLYIQRVDDSVRVRRVNIITRTPVQWRLKSKTSHFPWSCLCPIYDSTTPQLPPRHHHQHHIPRSLTALPLDNKMNSSSLGGAAAAAAAADTRIKGNLPPNIKQMLDKVMHEVMARPNVYGASIGERVSIIEASVVPKAEESTRTEARVVCEVTVTEGPSI